MSLVLFHLYTYRGQGQCAWLRILVNKKITAAEVAASESTNITPIFWCVVSQRAFWLILLSLTSTANENTMLLSIGSSHKTKRKQKYPWKVFWLKANRSRICVHGQEHEKDTKIWINIQNPFSGSAILFPEQLILCQILAVGFLEGIEEVFMKNSNPWSHKFCFPSKKIAYSHSDNPAELSANLHLCSHKGGTWHFLYALLPPPSVLEKRFKMHSKKQRENIFVHLTGTYMPNLPTPNQEKIPPQKKYS